MIPASFAPKIPSVRPQERPDPTGGYGKKVTAAPRRFTAAASGMWMWSVDLGDDRAQDHVWIPNVQ